MLWATCCLAFFGFLRCSEFTIPNQEAYDEAVHLSYRDISVDSGTSTIPGYLRFKLRSPVHNGKSAIPYSTLIPCIFIPYTEAHWHIHKRIQYSQRSYWSSHICKSCRDFRYPHIYKCWADGKVMPSKPTSKLLLKT